ncbi:glycoside hydrolase family 35 protein [Luteibacter aegosomatissinici]|uniref:glycoside hydrolase family 35 protein n=1 Tax=Luteibacter aegosomatissinici TaxID=2911539 RepID=UPI001FF7B641|nr:beta-galactosidase [Luteibacter aegosomatissinici]UPG93009.1 beta-galactosidase [Luteibacter aegosomatissinici]
MSCSKWPSGRRAACWAGLAMLLATAANAATPAPSTAHTVTFDRHSLIIDGKPTYIWSGSFHYWRLPSPESWKDVLQKMKAAGFNAVEIYFDWGYHSPKRGVYDFTGIRDVDRLLDMARDVGIYVIARPGPYINAETDAGGFPGWLVSTAGKPRSTAPEYTAAYQEWMTQIDRIIARHQITDGRGTVLLYQVENEFYNDSPDGRAYMQALEDKARADGITVPLFGNHNTNFFEGVGKLDMPGYDSYPMDFDCTRPDRWNAVYDFASERRGLKDTPLFFPEYQGGAFDVWGGPGYEACRKLTGPAFERVFYEATMASGSTMQNFYMTYGGMNWGWLSSPGVYTSYDYGAAITTSRQLTPKYDQQKLIGYMTRAAAPLARTDAVGTWVPDNPRLRVTARVNPDDGTRFYILRHADAADTTDDATHLKIALGKNGDTTIPLAPGTAIHINGRDSKVLLANFKFGQQDLVYSTSELLTQLHTGDRDIAVLYGRPGEDGETVLRYDDRPTVRVLDGKVETRWDAAAHTLRLNYRHDGLAKVEINGGKAPLLLLLGDNAAATRFWQLGATDEPVLLRGPYLARTAERHGGVLALTGDADRAGELEVFAPTGTRQVTWNGKSLQTTASASGSLLSRIDGPSPVALPALDAWHVTDGAPEIATTFDDRAWQATDRTSTPNDYWDHKLPILDSDDYGFHHGHVWYRGHFTATGKETAIQLSANLGVHLGNHGIFTAWINGHFLGNNPSGSQQFPIDPAWLKKGGDNVVSVLVENTGHLQEEHNGAFREPRGLLSARLEGSQAVIRWKIQGNTGGEDLVDPMRGPFNIGGLYGERNGWHLPGFKDSDWAKATLPRTTDKPGMDWYRTTFKLDIPDGQDAPIAIRIHDAVPLHYRAIVFINGWQIGRYISDVGPQTDFELPPGLLNRHGENTIAIASWSTAQDGGLGEVTLVMQGNYTTGLR